MSRIDTAKLINQATDFADRANVVRQDPAVVKAWKEASSDLVQAGRSTSRAISETSSVWRRAGCQRN